MTSIGYYPGCSLSGSAAEYDLSLRAVAAALDVELQEVPDWVCCGATSAHAIDHEAALVLASDTLAKASRAGIGQLLAPCAMCYSRLASTHHELSDDPALADEVADALEEPALRQFKNVRPINLLDWLADIGEDVLQAHVVRPLETLNVACYYGCLLVRPPKVTGATEVESPRTMENIVSLMGAKPVRWSMATECCGASFALSRKSVVLRHGLSTYDAARRVGANVICLACPMCHSNLDLRQAEFTGGKRDLPVLYLTQLIGLAFGLPPEELGLNAHFVPVNGVLAATAS